MSDCKNCDYVLCKYCGHDVDYVRDAHDPYCPKAVAKDLSVGGIKDSGQRTVYPNGFTRDMHTGKGRMDLLPWNAIIELSKHCENGALKYGTHNINKGCDYHSLADSGARHLAKWIAGIKDEPHLVASCWNLMWLLEETITRPDLNDMYWAEKGDDTDSKPTEPGQSDPGKVP